MFEVVQGAQGCSITLSHLLNDLLRNSLLWDHLLIITDRRKLLLVTYMVTRSVETRWYDLLTSAICYIFTIIFGRDSRSAVLLQRVYPVGWLGDWGWRNSDSFKHGTLFTTKHGLDLI